MRLSLAAVLALGAACAGCGSCGKAPPAAVDAAVAETPAPVPAPDGLLAEVWLRAPDALWGRIQLGVSGAAALLPPETGALACAALGLDPQVAPLLDGQATAYLVVADEPAGPAPDVPPQAGRPPEGRSRSFGWAAALPLKDPGRFGALLLDGDVARYTAREVAGMRVLARVDRPLAASVALAGRWLVVARDATDLERLGPYVWRSMPARPAPASPASVVAMVPGPAVAGPLASQLSAQWAQARAWLSDRDRDERARHGGRAPDFGDPQAILAALDAVVGRRTALLAGAQGASLELEAGSDEVHAELRLQPGPGEAGAGLVASMRPGDARPLADAPGDAVLGVLVRDDAAVRADDARELQAAVVRTLGARVTDDDGRALSAALDDWAASRGDWLTASLAWGPGHGVWMRTPGAAGARAVRETVDLLRRPALGEPLKRTFDMGPASVAPVAVAGLTDATLARFPVGAAPKNAPALGVAWATKDGQLLVAAGDDAPQLLAAEVAPAAHLGDDARVAKALSAVGSNASLVVLARPLRLDPGKAGTDAARAPAVLAWGRRESDAWLRVEVAGELLREMVRMQAFP